jgi:two-component system, NtrC family, response regulator
MRESVAIILNERESSKLKAVETLVHRLERLNITASRIPITKDICNVVRTRAPKIVVIDYLLGDYSTGLDVLSAIQSLEARVRPKVFFFTDEPSVPVAVSALKLGAENYFELEASDSISELVREISTTLNAPDATQAKPIITKKITFEEFVADSPSMIKIIKDTKLTIEKKVNPIVIYGPSGAGLTCLSRVVHNSLIDISQKITEIDLRFFSEKIEKLTGFPPNSQSYPVAGIHHALTIENVDEFDEELIEHLEKILPYLHSEKGPQLKTPIIVTTNSLNTAKALEKLTKSTILKIPPLNDRIEDLPRLIQQFIHEVEKNCGKRAKQADSEFIQWLCTLNWPRNVAQLHSVVVSALLDAIYNNKHPKSYVEEHRNLWDLACQEDVSNLDPLFVAKEFAKNNFNYRITAAKLGCSVSQIRQATSPNFSG